MSPTEFLNTLKDQKSLWEGPIELTRNSILKSAHSIDTNVYFITEGCVRVFVVDKNEEHTIRFGYTNNIITALDSYITNQSSELIIQALRKTTVYSISKSKLNDLILSSETHYKAWISILEDLILQHMTRERDLLTSSPQERFNRVLERSPILFQEVPHKYIASYLRMTPETLSRLINR